MNDAALQPQASGERPDFLTVFPKVALPMFLALADQSIVATALPAIAVSLGAVEQISLVVIGYLVAATVAAPVYGRLGDRFGRRRMLLVSLSIFMGCSVLCALSTSLTMLVAGRVVQGVGGGGLMALSQALLSETIEPRDRARYQGYLATVGVSSNALGPVLGGVLTDWLGWRSVFLFSLPLSVLAFVLIWQLPRRPVQGDQFRFDLSGFLLFASFVVSMLVLAEQAQRFSAEDIPIMLGLLAVVVVSVWALIIVERRVASPLLPLDMLRHPAIWRANVVAGCHGGILVSMITFVPIYLRVVHHTSPSLTGFLIAPMTVGIGVGSTITGRIIARTGLFAILPSWGMTVACAGLFLIAIFAPDLSYTGLSAALGVMALFMGTVMAVVQITVTMAAGPNQIGAVAAAVQYSRSLGAALVTALVATALFATLSWADPRAAEMFAQVLQFGAGALDGIPAEARQIAETQFREAFRAAFLVVCGVAFLSSILIWTLPIRRI